MHMRIHANAVLDKTLKVHAKPRVFEIAKISVCAVNSDSKMYYSSLIPMSTNRVGNYINALLVHLYLFTCTCSLVLVLVHL